MEIYGCYFYGSKMLPLAFYGVACSQIENVSEFIVDVKNIPKISTTPCKTTPDAICLLEASKTLESSNITDKNGFVSVANQR